jgi:hypothetical protein
MVALAVLVGAAGLVWADRAFPPAPAEGGSPAVVVVAPGDSRVVCAGGLKLAGEGDGAVVYDPRFDPNPTSVDSLIRGLIDSEAGGQSQALDEQSAPARFAARAVGLAVSQEVVGEAPVALTAFAVDAAGAADAAGNVPAPVAAGATFQHLADGDLRGVAASACVPANSESWIVAGSTETGSSSRLLLTNAGQTSVRADLTLWDGAGLVEAVGLGGLTVPPASQRAVLLEGFQGEAARLAVRVSATGGDLAVFLQHSRLEGLTQGGVELATPGLPPATELTVPGLNVSQSTFDSPRTSALRVLAPGDRAARLSVELWGPDGPAALPGLEDVTINPGAVTDLSLGGLPEGIYTAVIRSDQPVVAAGLSLRTGGEDQPEEFAWTASAASAASGYLVLPSSDLVARLAVAAASETRVELTPVGLTGELGATVGVDVAAETTLALDLAAMGADAETAAVRFSWAGPPGFLALAVSAEDVDGELISAVLPAGLSPAARQVRLAP